MAGDRTRARVAGLLVVLLALYATVSLAAAADAVPAEARVQLAPTGKLRVAFVMFEPALATRDAAGEPAGVAPDLARALAERVGIPLEPMLFDSPATYAASAGSLRWDIAIAGREAGGGAHVDFGPTVLLIDHEMLLAPGKTFRDLGEIDRNTVRVGVTIGTVDDQILAQRLKQAVIFRVLIGADNATQTLRNSGADLFAASLPFLVKVAAGVPGSRLLEPPFAVVPAVIAVSSGRPAALAYLGEFVREAKASGLIQRSIDRAGLQGVRVAPP